MRSLVIVDKLAWKARPEGVKANNIWLGILKTGSVPLALENALSTAASKILLCFLPLRFVVDEQ